MEYADYVRQLAQHSPDFAEQVKELRGMGGVMAWMASQGIALSQAEIIQQDEFSLDFVLPLPGEERWLVFGIT
jgi:hypothetical protein